MLLPIYEKDLKAIEPILENSAYSKPNLKISVYKNRRGKYKGVYIFCKADLGTCRVMPMFATGWDYSFIQIDNMKIITEPSAFD